METSIEKKIDEMCEVLRQNAESCKTCRWYEAGLCLGNCELAEDNQIVCEALYNAGYRKTSEVAEEIFAEIEKVLAMYSHIHKYAEEARKVTEEYADGTPCEMQSVWDVIPLHKNGWDDYETMCQLQENIGSIEKSRLLKEFEVDIAQLKKKYTEDEK